MKKKIIKLGLFITLGVISLTSCNRLLDAENPNSVSTSIAVSTLDGIEKINRGFYPILPATNNWYIQSLITDELVINPIQNLGGGIGYYKWSYSPGSDQDETTTLNTFRSYYNAIRRANLTLSNIDNIVISNSDIPKKQLLKAEALGLRAYAHFQVLQLFSPKYNANALGCAYVTNINDEALPSRDNMQTSYKKVLEDLNEASSLFSSISLDNDNTRINKYAIEALKAKVYLEIGEYDNAINSSNIVLNQYDLATSAQYLDIWADKNDYKEVIFKQKNTSEASSTISGQLFENSQGNIQYNASQTLLTKYESTDIRLSLFEDKGSNGWIPKKYLRPYAEKIKNKKGIADIKLIRTSDILLLRAEAYARKGDLNNSFTDYKKLRGARSAGNSDAFSSSSDALDKIFEERARELAYEGSRLFDIKRFEKTITRIKADSRQGYTNLTNTKVYQYTLPIPYAEIFANRNIQQNEQW